MVSIGTPLSPSGTRVLLLGAGELGKEVVIELQRLGIEVIAADRYPNAPAMQVAHRSHVLNMLDPQALRALVLAERPALIVPEIEAIATPALLELEAEGFRVIPTARAARLTMDREGIRRLAAETLGLRTSPYRFADDLGQYRDAVAAIGLPCVVKPVMSSSGKGQSLVRTETDIERAWDYAQAGGRAGAGRVIVEGLVAFDYEITLLTVRHAGGTRFCEPIGHLQVDGDYRESWQPQPMSPAALAQAQRIARAVTDDLGGRRYLRGRAVREGRRGVVQRGFASAARHRARDARLAGPLGVRAARPRDPRTAGAGDPAAGARRSVRGAGRGRLGQRAVPRRGTRAGRTGHSAAPVRQAGGARQAAHGVALALGRSIEEARDKARRAAQALLEGVQAG